MRQARQPARNDDLRRLPVLAVHIAAITSYRCVYFKRIACAIATKRGSVRS